MTTLTTLDLTLLRARILASLGLAPVLALAACDAELPDAAVEVSPTSELSRLSGPTPTLTLAVDTAEANRLATFTVSGAAPGAEVTVGWGVSVTQACPPSLAGACIDIAASATALEVGIADATGTVVLQEPVPNLADGSPIVIQAKAVLNGVVDVSPVAEGVVDHPVRACPEVPEVDPDDGLRDGRRRLVCSEPVNGACTAMPMTSWTAEGLYADAIGQSLAARWLVTASCEETSIVDACCYVMTTTDTGGGGGGYAGRPFEVAGRPRHAACGTGEGWAEGLRFAVDGLSDRLRGRLLAYWSKLAVDEHASVASFSRFNLELVALGAPSELLASSTRAIGDEIRHARVSFGIASVFAGAPVGPGRIAMDGALDRSGDPEAVLVAAILEGCVNETISAAQARAAAEGTDDPELRTLLVTIAADESRHAELSWAFVRWMLATRPELRDAAARAFDGFALGAAPAADPDREALAAFGMPTDDALHAVAVQVLSHVVRPCADLLLGRPAAAAVVSA